MQLSAILPIHINIIKKTFEKVKKKAGALTWIRFQYCRISSAFDRKKVPGHFSTVFYFKLWACFLLSLSISEK